MTEQNQISDSVDTTEAPIRFAKFKTAISKIKPIHVAIATTAVVTTAGMIIVSRLEKAMDEYGVVEETTIKVVPETDNT